VRGTTPTVDALAEAGLRYTAAYAQANWTLPSHATLFTGVLPSRHGMTGPSSHLGEDLPTLATLLHGAGYETVGFSENPWVSEFNGMTRGFDRFTLVNPMGLARGASEVGQAVSAWLGDRRSSAPFFVFVNLMDAHMPYEVRPENRFVPPGTDAATARGVAAHVVQYLCRASDHPHEMEILHGLYLGDVAAADEKLHDVVDRVRPAASDLVTVVTSDHGEHFGEGGLVLHAYGLHDVLLHVPLIVDGAPGARPAVIEAPVALADVLPTLLGWAGVPAPPGIVGRPLPTDPARADPAREVVSEYVEGGAELNGPHSRDACASEERVFGDMRAILRWPLKLVSSARYPVVLYDVARDPGETRDLASAEPDVVAALAGDLAAATGSARAAAAPGASPTPEVAARLRALGYLGADGGSR
jgi:arylsulfatase A-like enzyme